jgi:hypothetical protein
MDYVNRDNSWHLDKRLNVSHLVATATLIAGLFMWSGKIDTRIALVEQSQSQAQTAQRLIDVRQDDDMRAAVLSVKSEMRDINSKLDRLIEGKR